MIEEQLRKLAAKQKTWVGLVKGMGCNPAYVDDVVQDAYIRVYDYLSKGVDISYGEDDVRVGLGFLGHVGIFKELPKMRDMTDDMYKTVTDKTFFMKEGINDGSDY